MRKHKNMGFSLTEVVVVIAIMAVLLTVLIPSLLRYTEDSRAQKDASTAGEIVNAFRLALADQNCFDEMLDYSCTNNYITYTDSSGIYGQIIADGEYWAPDGSGRATTITFNPTTSGSSIVYRMDNAIVNDMTYGNGSIGSNRQMEGNRIDDIQCYFKNASLNAQRTGYTYNEVRQSIGDFVDITSQTYSNSSFTVFIKFSQKDNTTVAEVEGLFNGTNLYTGAESSNGSGTHDYSTDSNGNKKPVSTIEGGTSKPKYTNSDLAASGTLSGSTNIENDLKDYQEPTYIENLQKENEFEYYSSLYTAVQDINNDTIGKNADVDKLNGVAGVYTEKSGSVSVVLLKDTVETKNRIKTYKNTKIILGGHTLTLDGVNGISCEQNELIVDGRIHGSSIKNISLNTKLRCVSVQANGKAKIYGGTYIADQPFNADISQTSGVVGAIWSAGSLDIYNATIEVYSTSKCTARAIEIQKDCDYLFDTITIIVKSKGIDTTHHTTAAICISGGNLTLKNSTIYTESLNKYVGAINTLDNYGTINLILYKCNFTTLSSDGRNVTIWRETGYTGSMNDTDSKTSYGIAFQ